MNFLRRFAGGLIGLVFVLSSILKLIDPVGTGLIVEEYCKFLHINFLCPYAKILGEFLSLTEGIVGIGLVTGVFKRVFAILTCCLLTFFTFISIFLYVKNPEMSCGCFGQAIPLTHEQTLIKNGILDLLAILAFIPLRSFCLSLRSSFVSFGICSLFLIVTGIISWVQIPLIDFSEFRPSHTIVIENETSLSDYEYPVLPLWDEYGEDCSQVVLEGKVALISIYSPISQKQTARLARFAAMAENAGLSVYCVSCCECDIPGVTTYFADYRKLITLNRSSGGVTFLDNGYIIRKRSARLLLSTAKVNELAENDSTMIYVEAATSRSLMLQGLSFVFLVFLLLF